MLKNYPYKPPRKFYDLTKTRKVNDNAKTHNNWSMRELINNVNEGVKCQ